METPDPPNGNTPKRASKQVATWHPMASQGFLGLIISFLKSSNLSTILCAQNSVAGQSIERIVSHSMAVITEADLLAFIISKEK